MKQSQIQTWLDQVGRASVALKLVDQHIETETSEANRIIKAVKDKYAKQMDDLKRSSNEARTKLQEAMDNGWIPEQGVETDDWKLVQVQRSNPLLEDFNAVPDEFLVPVTQWIDWKKVDDYVKANNAVPAGFGLVKSYSPRIMANKKVKV